MHLLRLHRLKQCINITCLRNKMWIKKHLVLKFVYRMIPLIRIRIYLKEISQMHNTYNMVYIAFIHRKSRIILPQDEFKTVFYCSVGINCHYIFSVCHNIVSFLVTELNNVRYHLGLTVKQLSLLMSLLHDILNLIGHIIIFLTKNLI